MNANERIFVKCYDCHSTEDDFKNGEGEAGASWDSHDTQFENAPEGYASIEDALRAVCENECYKFVKENWIAFGKDYGDEFNRFDGDVMVDEANSQATEFQLEKWKKGEQKLWNCHIHVYLEIHTMREFTRDDLSDFIEGKQDDGNEQDPNTK